MSPPPIEPRAGHVRTTTAVHPNRLQPQLPRASPPPPSPSHSPLLEPLPVLQRSRRPAICISGTLHLRQGKLRFRLPSHPPISFQFSLSPDPQSWGADLSPSHREPDDFLHNPDPRRDRKRDRGGSVLTYRGLTNLGCLVFLALGLVALLYVPFPHFSLILTPSPAPDTPSYPISAPTPSRTQAVLTSGVSTPAARQVATSLIMSLVPSLPRFLPCQITLVSSTSIPHPRRLLSLLLPMVQSGNSSSATNSIPKTAPSGLATTHTGRLQISITGRFAFHTSHPECVLTPKLDQRPGVVLAGSGHNQGWCT